MLKYNNITLDDLPKTLDCGFGDSKETILHLVSSDKAMKLKHECGFVEHPMGLTKVYYERRPKHEGSFIEHRMKAQIILFLEPLKSDSLIEFVDAKQRYNILCYSSYIQYEFIPPFSFMGGNEQPAEGLNRWWKARGAHEAALEVCGDKVIKNSYDKMEQLIFNF